MGIYRDVTVDLAAAFEAANPHVTVEFSFGAGTESKDCKEKLHYAISGKAEKAEKNIGGHDSIEMFFALPAYKIICLKD